MERRINIEDSRAIAEKFDFQIKECFANSLTAFLMEFTDEPAAFYVESCVIMPEPIVLPIEHAWIEIIHDDHIEIIETTLVLTHTDEELTKYEYFDGARYTYKEANRLVMKEMLLPAAWRLKEKRLSWIAAQDASHLKAFGVSISDMLQIGKTLQ